MPQTAPLAFPIYLLPFLTLNRAILDMKIQRDKLHQYQRRITVLTDKETDIAREMLAKGDKERALLALRRKKYQQSLLSQTDSQLEQLEKLTSNVEFALIQKDVLFGLQQGTRVLSDIHKEMGGIENVEKLMGESADAIAYQQVQLRIGISPDTGQPPQGLKTNTFDLSTVYRKLAICSAVAYLHMTRTR
jgi:hypothetical protein